MYDLKIKDGICIREKKRKIKKFKTFVDKGTMSIDDVRISYNSWLGSAKRTNSYKTIQSMNKLFNKLFCT